MDFIQMLDLILFKNNHFLTTPSMKYPLFVNYVPGTMLGAGAAAVSVF